MADEGVAGMEGPEEAKTEAARFDPAQARERLLRAEREGLKLGIFCQTIAVITAFVWFVVGMASIGRTPSPFAVTGLASFALLGVVIYLAIGTRFDRPVLKFISSGTAVLGICLAFAIVPVSSGGDVPQIMAFRAYGIYYLFPMVALATLSLSSRLVLFTGAVAAAGWWASFASVVAPMETRLSWGDLPPDASTEEYLELFLSPDFIGTGNRIEETGLLLIATAILAIAVRRARRVLLAQIAAEAEREAERAERDRIRRVLGRYVPEAIAARLATYADALRPQVRHGAVLVADIAGFTAFAAGRPPQEVIAFLNTFLAGAADVIGEERGVVISFTGDGLLATFGTPLTTETPERAALAAAGRLIRFAEAEGFSLRIGIAAGPIAAGSVGSSRRQAFTVYGDTVNRAARLEALGKPLGEAILVDDAVAASHAAAGDDDDAATLHLEAAGSHRLAGLPAAVEVHAGRLSMPRADPVAAP